MFLAIFIALATTQSAPCSCAEVIPERQWLSGYHAVTPVLQPRQSEMLQRLGSRSIEEIDLSTARTIAVNRSVPPGKRYYLARAGYIGDGKRGEIPGGLSLSVDVDVQGIAYVASYRLTRARGTSELAVVLTSDASLRQVVSRCGAAE